MRTTACLVLSAVLLTGCANSPRPVPQGPHEPDVRFLEAAERSSAWALHMAELEQSRGERPEVKQVAAAIARRERANLQRLATERAVLGLPPGPADHHATPFANPHMLEDERELAAASGWDADWAYTQHMLAERRDLAALARFAAGELRSPGLRAYAQALPGERHKDSSELRAVRFAARPIPKDSRGDRGFVDGKGVKNNGTVGPGPIKR